MNRFLLLAGGLVLGLSAVAHAQAAPYCREYTEKLKVGNRMEEGYGTACMQPDGSWKRVSEAVSPPALGAVEAVPEVTRVVQQERIVYVPAAPTRVVVYGPGYYPHHWREHRFGHRPYWY